MFEHFGMIDVLYALWNKKKYLIYTFAFTVIICGIGFVLVPFFQLTSDTYNKKEDISKLNSYASSASYLISPDYSSGLYRVEKGQDAVDISLKMGNIYVSILNSDFCKEYVFNKVLKTYSKQDIIEVTRMTSYNPTIQPEDITMHTVAEFFHTDLYKGTPLLNIYASSYDKGFSKVVFQAYNDFLNQKIQKNLYPSKLQYMGGTDQTFIGENAADDNISLFKIAINNVVKPAVKNTVLAVIAMTVFYCIIVFTYALICPVINRKSDYSIYNINVIGEVSTNVKFGGDQS